MIETKLPVTTTFIAMRARICLFVAVGVAVTESLSHAVPHKYIELKEFSVPQQAELLFNFGRMGSSTERDISEKVPNEESSADGVVKGNYGYLDAGGMYKFVDYTTDRNGYRAQHRIVRLINTSKERFKGN